MSVSDKDEKVHSSLEMLMDSKHRLVEEIYDLDKQLEAIIEQKKKLKEKKKQLLIQIGNQF